MLMLKLISRFNKIPIKIRDNFQLIEINDLILKCVHKGKGPKGVGTILKMNKIEGLTVSGLNAYSN